MDPTNLPQYRWPNLRPVERRYIVRDDQGRYGIGTVDHRHNIMWAYPAGTAAAMTAPANLGLPDNAVIMTAVSWHLQDDGVYTGQWHDDPPEASRQLVIVDDLGWSMPDRWADIALAGSDQMGHWVYGATLGKIGGEPPVVGMAANEMTADQAEEYAREVGESVSARGVRFAARHGYIPGARKIGRDWVIPYEGFNQYLDNRPKPGRKPTIEVRHANQSGKSG